MINQSVNEGHCLHRKASREDTVEFLLSKQRRVDGDTSHVTTSDEDITLFFIVLSVNEASAVSALLDMMRSQDAPDALYCGTMVPPPAVMMALRRIDVHQIDAIRIFIHQGNDFTYLISSLDGVLDEVIRYREHTRPSKALVPELAMVVLQK